MDPSNPEIALEVPPYLRVHKNGTIERFAGIEVAPAGFDSETSVVSKDILIIPATGVTARFYYPNSAAKTTKLPLVFYLHGGAFCISSPSDPLYHNSLNRLVAESNVVAVSVDYRLAPEHPLPAAYEDSWAALKWVASHASEHDDGEGEGCGNLLRDRVDFKKVFLAGDSAGANMGHYMALKLDALSSDPSFSSSFKVLGLVMVNPYFWGKEPIGVEITDTERKKMVDLWWGFLCPSDKGSDDPLINPFVGEAPGFEGVGCNKVLVIVAEKDILKERGKLYHKKLVNSSWQGTAEFYEIQGEDHVFHIFNPDCENAKRLFKRIAAFINQH